MTLRAVLEQGEDGFLIASVPALPSCFSQGRTREEATANIKEAILGWLESQDDVVPEPGLEVIKIAV